MTTTRLSTLVSRVLLDHAAASAPAPAKSLEVIVLCKDRAAAQRVHEQIAGECDPILKRPVRRNPEKSWWSLGDPDPSSFLRLHVTRPSLQVLQGVKCDVLFIQDDADNAWREIRGSKYPPESLDEIIRVLDESQHTVVIAREATDFGALPMDSADVFPSCSVGGGTESDSHDEIQHVQEVD